MANPMMSKKMEETFTVTDKVKRLFQEVYREQNKHEKSDDEVPRIKVSELVSKMSFYYEKLRNMVDYKEEYLLRKNAIERILKRLIIIEDKISIKHLKPKEVAKNLLVELIRAAYLPNNFVPEYKIEEAEKIIDKYLLLRKYTLENLKINKKYNTSKTRNELTKWIISLAATNIEENLRESGPNKIVVDYMYDILTKHIVLSENSPYEKDKDIQIYLGIHRNYLNYDYDMLSYILLKYYAKNWDNADDEEIKKVASQLVEMNGVIKNQIDHPLSRQLDRLINRYTVFFTILLDVIEENPVLVYDFFKKDPKAFPRLIKKMCNKKYGNVRKKLRWAAFRSILYIFTTKAVLIIIFEKPIILFLGGEVNNVLFLINILFPPLLLFLSVLFTRMPSDTNTAKIIEGIEEVTFIEKERKEKFKLRKIVKREGFINAVFTFIYRVSFLLIFGFIIYVLDRYGFEPVSIVIFLFFLALISFFSIRIKRGVKKLIILPAKDSILSFFSDILFVPIIQVGKWLNEKFDKINVITFVLDVLIESPFKFFVEVTDQWSKYVKERKEDIS